MYFAYGEVTPLTGKEWYPLELHSGESCTEMYLRRVIKAVPGIFREQPAELYVPLKNRDLDEFELLEGPFVYVRSGYFIGVVRLRKVWGVVGLVTTGGTRLLKDVLKVESDYVEKLRTIEREEARKRQEGIKTGQGVRILDGKFRDLCGTVTHTNGNGEATVLIDFKFRKIELTTYRQNLRTIDTSGEDVCWIPNLLREAEENSLKAEEL